MLEGLERIDELLRTVNDTRLEESAAVEPDQDQRSDAGESAALELDDGDARRGESASDAPSEPTVTQPAARPAPAELKAIQNGRSSHETGAGQSSGSLPKSSDVPTSALITQPDLAGELKTIVATSAAPEATPEAPAGQPRRGSHSLIPLEAASELAESLGLGFHLGGAVERIAFGASNGRDGVAALREASWLIERYISLVEERPLGADLHAESVRLAHWGDALAELRVITRTLAADARENPPPVETEPSRADAAVQPRLAPLTDRETLPASEPTPPADHEPRPRPEPNQRAEPNTATAAEAEHEPRTRPEPNQRAELNTATAAEAEAAKPSFSYEVRLMAVRLGMIVVGVTLIVLALTLIGQYF